MKILSAFAFVWFLLLLACKPADVTPTQPIDDSFDSTQSVLLKRGELIGVGHTVMGTAKIYKKMDGKKVVLLDPYSSQNGPDLKVYLSKDFDAGDYIRLGNLKSTNGSQSYNVPGDPDIAEYHYVHIWCEKFTVVFGRAEVK